MSEEPENPQINISKIPVGRGIGAALVIIALIVTLLVALPELRWPTLLGVAGGIVFAAALILWHRRKLR